MPKSTDPLARDAASAATPEAGRAGRRGPADGEFGEAGFEASPADLQPIGPERLKKLRESIRNGTYPLEARARSGLLRMFLGHPTPRSETHESD